MNKSYVINLIAAASILTACSTNANSTLPAQPLTYQDLQHHRFVLQTFNDKTISDEIHIRPVSIEFNENQRVSGRVCNNFFGQATFQNNLLTMRPASTHMACLNDDLNTAEQALFKALENGASLQLNGKTLTLVNSNDTFVYTLQDYVQ